MLAAADRKQWPCAVQARPPTVVQASRRRWWSGRNPQAGKRPAVPPAPGSPAQGSVQVHACAAARGGAFQRLSGSLAQFRSQRLPAKWLARRAKIIHTYCPPAFTQSRCRGSGNGAPAPPPARDECESRRRHQLRRSSPPLAGVLVTRTSGSGSHLQRTRGAGGAAPRPPALLIGYGNSAPGRARHQPASLVHRHFSICNRLLWAKPA